MVVHCTFGVWTSDRSCPGTFLVYQHQDHTQSTSGKQWKIGSAKYVRSIFCSVWKALCVRSLLAAVLTPFTDLLYIAVEWCTTPYIRDICVRWFEERIFNVIQIRRWPRRIGQVTVFEYRRPPIIDSSQVKKRVYRGIQCSRGSAGVPNEFS